MRHVMYGLTAAMLSSFWLGLVLVALHSPDRRAAMDLQVTSGNLAALHERGVEKFAAYQAQDVRPQ